MPDIASTTSANRQPIICPLSCQASRDKRFTPAIETLRGLLLGTEIGHNGWLVVARCLGLTVLAYLWSTSRFNRDPSSTT